MCCLNGLPLPRASALPVRVESACGNRLKYSAFFRCVLISAEDVGAFEFFWLVIEVMLALDAISWEFKFNQRLASTRGSSWTENAMSQACATQLRTTYRLCNCWSAFGSHRLSLELHCCMHVVLEAYHRPGAHEACDHILRLLAANREAQVSSLGRALLLWLVFHAQAIRVCNTFSSHSAWGILAVPRVLSKIPTSGVVDSLMQHLLAS